MLKVQLVPVVVAVVQEPQVEIQLITIPPEQVERVVLLQ